MLYTSRPTHGFSIRVAVFVLVPSLLWAQDQYRYSYYMESEDGVVAPDYGDPAYLSQVSTWAEQGYGLSFGTSREGQQARAAANAANETGFALYESGDHVGAQLFFWYAALLNPKHPYAHFNRACSISLHSARVRDVVDWERLADAAAPGFRVKDGLLYHMARMLDNDPTRVEQIYRDRDVDFVRQEPWFRNFLSFRQAGPARFEPEPDVLWLRAGGERVPVAPLAGHEMASPFGGEVEQPVWLAPSGRHAAFIANAQSNRNGAFLLALADTSAVMRVLPQTLADGHPTVDWVTIFDDGGVAWSPGGSMFVFANAAGLFAYFVDSYALVQITDARERWEIDWRPEFVGDRVVQFRRGYVMEYGYGGETYTYDLSTGGESRIDGRAFSVQTDDPRGAGPDDDESSWDDTRGGP